MAATEQRGRGVVAAADLARRIHRENGVAGGLDDRRILRLNPVQRGVGDGQRRCRGRPAEQRRLRLGEGWAGGASYAEGADGFTPCGQLLEQDRLVGARRRAWLRQPGLQLFRLPAGFGMRERLVPAVTGGRQPQDAVRAEEMAQLGDDGLLQRRQVDAGLGEDVRQPFPALGERQLLPLANLGGARGEELLLV